MALQAMVESNRATAVPFMKLVQEELGAGLTLVAEVGQLAVQSKMRRCLLMTLQPLMTV